MRKKLVIGLLGIGLFQAVPSQAYTGRLQCKTLAETLTRFSALHVKSYCKEALQACRLQKMLDRLDKQHPLHQALDGRLHDKITLALEICELAFLDHDPTHYEENLQRPTLPSPSPSRQAAPLESQATSPDKEKAEGLEP